MAVLYRKYRPQSFSEVVGQTSIIKTLQNQVKTGQIAHAYLFVGSRGVGKTSVARILAKAVNCEKSAISNQQSAIQLDDACGECEVCRSIANGNYIDLIEIDAASNTGVDNVRELIEHVRFAPSVGRYKVFIIDEVHMLSKGAFNALLKTLEEPPGHAIFVLATTEVGKVPATIISRTQRFDFKRLSVQDIEDSLGAIIKKENARLPQEAVRLIALHSEGGLRDALSLLDKVLTLGQEPRLDEVLQIIGVTDTALSERLMRLIVQGQAADIPKFIDELLEQGVDFAAFNRDFLEYAREILILKISPHSAAGLSLLEGHLENARDLANQISENEIVHILRLFLRSFKEQQTAPAADLPVLLAAVEAAMTMTRNGVDYSLHKGGAIAGRGSNSLPKAERKAASVSSPKIEVANNTAGKTSKAVAELPTAHRTAKVVNLTLEQIGAQWTAVIEKLKNINGPLAHLLKSSPLDRIEGARIIVNVKYRFHKQNLEHPKNQESIGKILKEVYGCDLALAGEVKSAEEAAAASALSDALKVFGGEMID